MDIRPGISEKVNCSLIGKRMQVLVDRQEDGYYVGRTEHDSPEVDPEVLINTDTALKIGTFYQVEITGADEYDLFAQITKE